MTSQFKQKFFYLLACLLTYLSIPKYLAKTVVIKLLQ